MPGVLATVGLKVTLAVSGLQERLIFVRCWTMGQTFFLHTRVNKYLKNTIQRVQAPREVFYLGLFNVIFRVTQALECHET